MDFFQNIEQGTARIEGTGLMTIRRPYGFSVVLDANTRIHTLTGEPSVQVHHFRAEEYVMYSGQMTVYRGVMKDGDEEAIIASMEPTELRPGDRVVIPAGTPHLPVNYNPELAVFIEISHGPYEESDILRIYDKLGRDPEVRERWEKLGYKTGVSIVDLIREAQRRPRKQQ